MNIIRKILLPFRTMTSDEYLNTLRKNGADIGEGTHVYDTSDVFIDNTRPWLLKIGEYTKITKGVKILTHDYSLSVLRRVYGQWIGEGCKTIIGDNCFIGMGSVILMGSKVGDNVIIGAGSVVRGCFPSNVVIAGNPAKIICSLEDYYNKRLSQTANEAKECARTYFERFQKLPTPRDLGGFKFLFLKRDEEIVKKSGCSFNCTGDNSNEVESAFYKTEPLWDSFEDFLHEAGLLDSNGAIVKKFLDGSEHENNM